MRKTKKDDLQGKTQIKGGRIEDPYLLQRSCKHDWIKLSKHQKAWVMIFIYVNDKSEKLVCKKCAKVIYA